MDTKHLDPLRKELRLLRATVPPKPWRSVGVIAVGGLHAVGFDRVSELLLVVSSAGRGVIDCQTGSKVARDSEEYYGNEQYLEADGIGPLKGRTLTMTGLLGGGLPKSTSDGWSVEVVTLDWPVGDILLLEPFSSMYDSLRGKSNRFHKVASDSELRAVGFSYSGLSLIVATSSDVAVFCRDAV
ncbi:MAG: hypothetical protein KME14_10335 [Tildeniella torsiva UHER 1998/13D]|jgi:hypothetical protein|nr:hypothetical protein [Tildeniella torsiva UHER 1998/13D]